MEMKRIMPSDRIDTMIKIANMYYRDELSQQEIAQKVDMSRTTVSRILKNCIEDGIVTINIKDTSTHQYELEKKLKDRYGLKHVSVVSNNKDKEFLIDYMGDSVAEYLEHIVNRDVRIGISSGVTLASIVRKLGPVGHFHFDVFQMLGDASHQTSNCSSFLAIELARMLGGTPHAMHIPLLVHTKVLKDLLLEEPFNKKHFQELPYLDIALVGLGTLDGILPSTSDTWYNFEADKEELRMHDAVGDVCGVFIDSKGNLCDTDIQNRTIAIPLNDLKNIPNCIAIAAGDKKRHIARAAIKGGYINVLITDETLANALLAEK